MDVFDAMLRRRSIRVYQDRPVERDKIRILLEAAMAAPSACNFQPWEFIVVDEPEGMDRLRSCIGPANGRSYKAPAAVVVCENTAYIPWKGGCSADCCAAVENLLLAVTALDLGAVWIGDFDPGQVSENLNIPGHVLPAAIVLFGYPDETKEPRTQYTDDAVFWQRYDPDRQHAKRRNDRFAR